MSVCVCVYGCNRQWIIADGNAFSPPQRCLLYAAKQSLNWKRRVNKSAVMFLLVKKGCTLCILLFSTSTIVATIIWVLNRLILPFMRNRRLPVDEWGSQFFGGKHTLLSFHLNLITLVIDFDQPEKQTVCLQCSFFVTESHHTGLVYQTSFSNLFLPIELPTAGITGKPALIKQLKMAVNLIWHTHFKIFLGGNFKSTNI